MARKTQGATHSEFSLAPSLPLFNSVLYSHAHVLQVLIMSCSVDIAVWYLGLYRPDVFNTFYQHCGLPQWKIITSLSLTYQLNWSSSSPVCIQSQWTHAPRSISFAFFFMNQSGFYDLNSSAEGDHEVSSLSLRSMHLFINNFHSAERGVSRRFQ